MPYVEGSPLIDLFIKRVRMDVPADKLIENSTVFRQESNADLESSEYVGNNAGGGCTYETDPTIFQHFLAFAHRGKCQLFYKDSEGFDRGLYKQLRESAYDYGVTKLFRWIDNKRFEEVVLIHYTHVEADPRQSSEEPSPPTHVERSFCWGREAFDPYQEDRRPAGRVDSDDGAEHTIPASNRDGKEVDDVGTLKACEACDDLVTWQVGSSRFHTNPSELASTPNTFAEEFGRDDEKRHARTQDGAYMIEADPEMFSHYLDFTLTGHFPLFYKDKDGFNRGRCELLLNFSDDVEFLSYMTGFGRKATKTPCRSNMLQSIHRLKFIHNGPTPEYKFESSTWKQGNFENAGRPCTKSANSDIQVYESTYEAMPGAEIRGSSNKGSVIISDGLDGAPYALITNKITVINRNVLNSARPIGEWM